MLWDLEYIDKDYAFGRTLGVSAFLKVRNFLSKIIQSLNHK